MGEVGRPAPDPEKGGAQIQWARRSMPLSKAAMDAVFDAQPCHIGITLGLDPALASLAAWLAETGFKVSLLAESTAPANLLSALEEAGVVICAACEALLARQPDIVLDRDGAVLAQLSSNASGGTIASLHLAPECAGIICPAIHIGAAPLIALTTSQGLGQATVSGFLDITNLQIAGHHVLVIGYGAIGEGVAHYAHSFGAKAMVVEADPVKALKANLDGHEVARLDEVLGEPTLVINSLERRPALTLADLERLRSGVFLCSATANPEAFPLSQLHSNPPAMPIRDHIDEHSLGSGTKIGLVCEGKPIPFITGQGLPLEYADIQIAAQIRSIAQLLDPQRPLEAGIRPMANAIEADLAHGYLDRE